jgi:hypothetical protein
MTQIPTDDMMIEVESQLSLGGGEVVLVRYPTQTQLRGRLRAACIPHLLLVDDDVEPPAPDDVEDWIRASAADGDVWDRAQALARRCSNQANAASETAAASEPIVGIETTRPFVDEAGLLHRGDDWVALPGIAERLARYLLERSGEVVFRAELAAAAWSSAERVRSNLLDVHIARLRRKAEPLGLTIHTIRRRGYLLEIHDADGRSPWERPDT